MTTYEGLVNVPGGEKFYYQCTYSNIPAGEEIPTTYKIKATATYEQVELSEETTSVPNSWFDWLMSQLKEHAVDILRVLLVLVFILIALRILMKRQKKIIREIRRRVVRTKNKEIYNSSKVSVISWFMARPKTYHIFLTDDDLKALREVIHKKKLQKPSVADSRLLLIWMKHRAKCFRMSSQQNPMGFAWLLLQIRLSFITTRA